MLSIIPWREISHCLMVSETDDWLLTLFNDCYSLEYFKNFTSADDRIGTFELLQLDGADPVDLFSVWEVNRLNNCSRRSESACRLKGDGLAASAILKAGSKTVAITSLSSQSIAAKFL